MRLSAFVALLALGLASCSDATGPSTVVAGTWVGPVQGRATSMLTMTLQQHGQAVTGTGALAGSVGIPATFDGILTGRSLSITVELTGYESANLTGTVSGNAFTGTMNGSGFVNAVVSLTRQ